MGASGQPAAAVACEVSTRVAHPIARWVRAHRGDAVADELIAASGLTRAELESVRWLPHERFEAMLAVFARVVTTDDEIRAASIDGLADAYGPVRFMLRASTPERLYRVAAKAVRFLSTFSRIEVEPVGPRAVRLRYTSPVRESRVACVGRRAHVELLPTFCGLPAATVVEEACAANGDDACVYLTTWPRERRYRQHALGLALGARRRGRGGRASW